MCVMYLFAYIIIYILCINMHLLTFEIKFLNSHFVVINAKNEAILANFTVSIGVFWGDAE